MQRNFRHYLLNIELLKPRSIFFTTAAAFLLYIFLVMIASKGSSTKFILFKKGPQLYDSH